MFIIGAPLGSLIKRGGIGVPVIISIIFYIVYYVLNILGIKWAREDIISPELAAWLSNLVLFPIGLFFLYHSRKDSRIFETSFLEYFNDVLSIRNLENEDKNLLRLKKAIFISNTVNEKEMLDLLNPIINSDSVWKTQSLKFLGDYYFSLKQFKKAENYYSTLLNYEDSTIDLKEIKRKIKSIQNG